MKTKKEPPITDERAQHLENCYQEGIKFAEAFKEYHQLFGNRCCELLIDKDALYAFSEPVGWGGKNWGKAALRFPDWFADNSAESPTAWQLMTLAKFSRLSNKKCQKLFDRWLSEGASWDLYKVDEECENLGAKVGCGESLKLEADVKFDKHGNTIIAVPKDKFAWDRGNGTYIVRMRSKKR